MLTEFHCISFMDMSSTSEFIPKQDLKQIEFEVTPVPTSQFEERQDKFELKREEKQIEFGVSSKPTSKFEESEDKFELKREENQIEFEVASKPTSKFEEIEEKFELQKRSVGEIEVAEDDDDGFRTPTSLDNKIPVITKCPPAPKKPRLQPPRKRKLSPPIRRRLELNLLNEVESMFPPRIEEDLERKIKKARRENTE